MDNLQTLVKNRKSSPVSLKNKGNLFSINPSTIGDLYFRGEKAIKRVTYDSGTSKVANAAFVGANQESHQYVDEACKFDK